MISVRCFSKHQIPRLAMPALASSPSFTPPFPLPPTKGVGREGERGRGEGGGYRV